MGKIVHAVIIQHGEVCPDAELLFEQEQLRQRLLAQLAPEATCTLELMQDRPSLRWLEEQNLLE